MKKISDKERAKRLIDKCDRICLIGMCLFTLFTIILNISREWLGSDHLIFQISVIGQIITCIVIVISMICSVIFASKCHKE